MKIVLLLLLILGSLLANELKNETSPYLRQHSTNPVNWYPWGDAAFLKAKQEQKPIYLSIGYSTCHWCHVMEKESFTNKKIANLLNKYFISIKIDREELPFVDSYYQDIYFKKYNRMAGWPINVFVTPQKEAFFISTYLPAKTQKYYEGLETLIPKYAKIYSQQGRKLQELIKDLNEHKKNENSLEELSLLSLSNSLKNSYDEIYGGFGNTKKFPQAAKLSLMMDIATLLEDDELKEMSYDMLDAMAMRGLYDHVEGGFFRYASNASWRRAHYEKMLYTQAELIPLYTKAYLLTKKPLYKKVVDETIEFVEKTFVQNGLFYSASDTDADGVEGAYFLYTIKELHQALKTNKYAKELKIALEIDDHALLDDKMVIGFDTAQRPKGYEEFIAKLKQIRKSRKFPFIDKKINTAWNAMMISALYYASKLDEKYLFMAQEHLEKLQAFMFRRGELYHQSLIGVSPKQSGLLEDYSFMISALISGYEISYDHEKLDLAYYLLAKAKNKFYHEGVWNHNEGKFIVKANMIDKYYTSALGNMLQNILKLSALASSHKYEQLAVDSLRTIEQQLNVKQSDAPASAKAYLMNKIKVLTLKSSKKNLLANAKRIDTIAYPFLLTKVESFDKYLTCSLDSCFSIDNNLDKIIKDIEGMK